MTANLQTTNPLPAKQVDPNRGFLRPSESDRAARARAWIRMARGLPPADLQVEAEQPRVDQ
jgi:hypothetical protein